MPSAEEFTEAAAQATTHWGLEVASIELLSHSENVVFDVALASGDHVVLRLHRPGYNNLDEMRSEVMWVDALASAGVRVPRCLAGLDGEYYTAVPVGDEVRQAGLIEWVDGEPIGEPISEMADMARADVVVGHYDRIGQLAAQLRHHNDEWTPPDSFVRRRWDAQGLMGESPLWGRFWQVDGLSDEQRELFAEARDRLYVDLSALSTGPDRFGRIHADLHLGNVMADGDKITVIDFDDAGYGWFAHELAVALHPVTDEAFFDDARDAIVTGYRRIHGLDDAEVELIDTFLTVRCLMLVGWLDARRELPAYEYFEPLASEAELFARRYLS